MANAVFSFEEFDCHGAKEAYCPLQEFRRYDEQESQGKQTHVFGARDWGDFNNLNPNYGFLQDESFEIPTSNNQQPVSDLFMEDYVLPDVVSAAIIQQIQEPVKHDPGLDCTHNSSIIRTAEILESKKEKVHPTPFASLRLLNSYKTGHRLLNEDKKLNKSAIEVACHAVRSRDLSTEEVMRVAAARYIESSVQMDGNHPLGSMPFTSLTDQETTDVELAHLLLASSEKIGNQQYDRARYLLTKCKYMSSKVGNPVQRVVHYFAVALHERINRETERLSLSAKVVNSGRWGEDTGKAIVGGHPALLTVYKMVPIGQVTEFTAVQSIIDNMASAKRVHLIDLGIEHGHQWIILMQALAERFMCPVELLKISAVAVRTLQKNIEETGERLVSFAKTLNLPFAFRPVIVSDMKDLNRDLFELKPEEVVGVYATNILHRMIYRPECLEHLMRVIRSIKPCIMLVTEIDANINSPSFFTRFTENLFYVSAWFDCLDESMDRSDHDRMSIESNFFSEGITSIVATEGSERIVRHVGVNVWRSFFARFRFVEIDLNHWSLYQASLLLKKNPCGSSCTLYMNGKSLSIGWKGTPLHFVSAWKLK